MKERVCYFNGKYIKDSDARVSISDWGIWEGGVYEVARTYNHIPFKLKEHIDRLFSSLNALPFIKFNRTPEEVVKIGFELMERNKALIAPWDDTRIIFRISRGICYSPSSEPTFFAHLVPISETVTEDYRLFAKWYKEGMRLVVAATRQVPSPCMDPRVKNTNRLVNRLAQYEANMADPEAYAVMMNIYGRVTECPRDNFFIVRDGKLLTSRVEDCLAGVTRDTVFELAGELKIDCSETDLSVYDLYQADEIMVTGTTIAVVPVSKFNSRVMPSPIPGPITRKLQVAFGKLVNYDIVERTLENAVDIK